MTSRFFSRLRDLYAARRDPEGMRSLSRAYWRTLLMCMAAMVIGGIAFGLHDILETFVAISDTPTNAATPSVTFDRPKLKSVLEALTDKSNRYQQGMAATSTPDPSI